MEGSSIGRVLEPGWLFRLLLFSWYCNCGLMLRCLEESCCMCFDLEVHPCLQSIVVRAFGIISNLHSPISNLYWPFFHVMNSFGLNSHG